MTAETTIHELDEDTVARIAAGEVVERPASAVKELVENSLDADASRIEVTIEAGGTDLIRVADDGYGMTEADLRAAVRQHTTSKIDGLEDLESGVATLGFRGEALHTIGSVSRLTIRSRPRADSSTAGSEASDVGTELVYEGGDVVSVEPAGCPEGTVVEVADLFYNTPARRKFLKTTATEFAHVNRVVTRYALANPEVAVSLTHDGREVFATTGQGDLQGAVLSVYGRDVASSMIPVEADADELPPGPLESVSGLVSHPETNRSSREYLSTYVNGRAVTSDAIREGIMGAYGTQLGGDRYPFVTLFLAVPGDAVDVNVHPRKREVRFDDDDAVRRQVDAAVEAALLEHGLLRSRAPRGRSAPDEARLRGEQSQVTDRAADETRATAARDASGDSEAGDTSHPGDGAGSEVTTESATSSAIDSAGDPAPQSTTEPTTDSVHRPDGTDGSTTPSGPSSDDDGDRRVDDADRIEADSASSSPPVHDDGDASSALAADSVDSPSAAGSAVDVDSDSDSSATSGSSAAAGTGSEPADSGVASGSAAGDGRKFSGEVDQQTLEGESATGEEAEFDSLPPLRVLGQLHDTYVVCEGPDGLVLIDQHAADERVNYERLRDAFADDPPAQALASPVDLELTAAEAETFEVYREALARLGFYADRSDDRTVTVTTVPAVFDETLAPERIRDVLTAIVDGDREAGAETVDALADEFLGDLACYPSITGNTSLTEGSVIDLLSELDACENPYACPHGRPVVLEVDREEIETRFERDYPGHGG
ncbi:DNA mismatch repair endonuclease MutL [Natrarchaeobaculum aegyptiacum]|uniref:DNA mismatch repair protein MutL n=1 Tax=Natrarchaeobaculum aegyptiacum TaxID=745377 RepID=A0A2Z2HNQ5_9EURY|nr:DNA mismatch repair endonuclease MutL [Natrarchaeobaculum aegyptiacum]ARS88596.1 DNA mismatch repair protein MutL [Natrarchaeobaculum aegyptiacum]